MEEFINKETVSQQNNQEQQNNSYLTESTTDETGFKDITELDIEQRQEIEALLKGDANYVETDNDNDVLLSSFNNKGINFGTSDKEEEAIKGFLVATFDIEPTTLDYIDVYNINETKKFLFTYLKNWYYPTEETEAFASFVANGGTLQEFVKALAPVDFNNLSDEEVIALYYQNRMEETALNDYIDALKATSKLEKRANEIRKEVGVVELSPNELLQKQKEMQLKQKQWLDNFKNNVYKTINKLNLRFKSNAEKEDFVEAIVQPKTHYDEDGNPIFFGSEYAFVLNADIEALIITAYHLYNYEEQTQKQKSTTDTIENIKKNLIQNRNIGISNFGI